MEMIKYFLPLHILQRLLKIGSIIMALLGFGVIVISATSMGEEEYWLPVAQDHKKNYAIGCLAFGITLLICGLFKIRGTWQQRSKWLITAQVFTIILFVAAVALAAIGNTEIENIFGNQPCEEVSWLEPFRKVETEAKSTLCKQYCKCYLNPKDFDRSDFDKLKQYNYDEVDTSLPIQFQECPKVDWSKFTADQNKAVKTLKYLEAEYECSGFCDNDYIFKFSNINRGNPDSKNCFQVIGDNYHFFGEVAMYVNIFLSIFLFFSVMVSICLFFHPYNRSKSLLKKMDFIVDYQKAYSHYSYKSDILSIDKSSQQPFAQMETE